MQRLRNGVVHNVRFKDFRYLVEALGFELVRVKGSHHVYRHPAVGALLSLQDVRGQAKPYQILRQFLRTIEHHGLGLEGE